MSSICTNQAIRVGVLTDEQLRMEGLASIFEKHLSNGYAPLIPVFGEFVELLSDLQLLYVIVDLNTYSIGVETVKAIYCRRPDMRLIVIGPEGDDKLIMDIILAGARAYLDVTASPQRVRQAIDVVISGSIWAPLPLLSQLIDQRLATASDVSLTSAPPRLTDRERQVLELILTACPNREIARRLGIEEGTVQGHVGRLMRKTGVDNRIGLLMSASNPALLETAEIRESRRDDRRHVERRRVERQESDRRQGDRRQ